MRSPTRRFFVLSGIGALVVGAILAVAPTGMADAGGVPNAAAMKAPNRDITGTVTQVDVFDNMARFSILVTAVNNGGPPAIGDTVIVNVKVNRDPQDMLWIEQLRDNRTANQTPPPQNIRVNYDQGNTPGGDVTRVRE